MGAWDDQCVNVDMGAWDDQCARVDMGAWDDQCVNKQREKSRTKAAMVLDIMWSVKIA